MDFVEESLQDLLRRSEAGQHRYVHTSQAPRREDQLAVEAQELAEPLLKDPQGVGSQAESFLARRRLADLEAGAREIEALEVQIADPGALATGSTDIEGYLREQESRVITAAVEESMAAVVEGAEDGLREALAGEWESARRALGDALGLWARAERGEVEELAKALATWGGGSGLDGGVDVGGRVSGGGRGGDEVGLESEKVFGLGRVSGRNGGGVEEFGEVISRGVSRSWASVSASGARSVLLEVLDAGVGSADLGMGSDELSGERSEAVREMWEVVRWQFGDGEALGWGGLWDSWRSGSRGEAEMWVCGGSVRRLEARFARLVEEEDAAVGSRRAGESARRSGQVRRYAERKASGAVEDEGLEVVDEGAERWTTDGSGYPLWLQVYLLLRGGWWEDAADMLAAAEGPGRTGHYGAAAAAARSIGALRQPGTLPAAAAAAVASDLGAVEAVRTCRRWSRETRAAAEEVRSAGARSAERTAWDGDWYKIKVLNLLGVDDPLYGVSGELSAAPGDPAEAPTDLVWRWCIFALAAPVAAAVDAAESDDVEGPALSPSAAAWTVDCVRARVASVDAAVDMAAAADPYGYAALLLLAQEYGGAVSFLLTYAGLSGCAGDEAKRLPELAPMLGTLDPEEPLLTSPLTWARDAVHLALALHLAGVLPLADNGPRVDPECRGLAALDPLPGDAPAIRRFACPRSRVASAAAADTEPPALVAVHLGRLLSAWIRDGLQAPLAPPQGPDPSQPDGFLDALQAVQNGSEPPTLDRATARCVARAADYIALLHGPALVATRQSLLAALLSAGRPSQTILLGALDWDTLAPRGDRGRLALLVRADRLHPRLDLDAAADAAAEALVAAGRHGEAFELHLRRALATSHPSSSSTSSSSNSTPSSSSSSPPILAATMAAADILLNRLRRAAKPAHPQRAAWIDLARRFLRSPLLLDAATLQRTAPSTSSSSSSSFSSSSLEDKLDAVRTLLVASDAFELARQRKHHLLIQTLDENSPFLPNPNQSQPWQALVSAHPAVKDIAGHVLSLALQAMEHLATKAHAHGDLQGAADWRRNIATLTKLPQDAQDWGGIQTLRTQIANTGTHFGILE